MNKKLAIFSAEYLPLRNRDNPRPCVALIGRDEKGNKLKYRVPFDPYILVEEWAWKKVKDKAKLKAWVKQVEQVNIRTPKKRSMTKLVCYDCRDVAMLDKYLRKNFHVRTYEADMSKMTRFPLKFLIDSGIKSGVEIKDGVKIPEEMECNLRRWYLDFEWTSEYMGSTNPRRDDPIIMATIYDNHLDAWYTLHIKPHPDDPTKSKGYPFEPMYKNHYIEYYRTERDLVKRILDLTNDLDWDLITGWNLMRADIVKLFSRMDKYGMKVNVLSPFGKVDRRQWPYIIRGRIIFDLMLAFKLFTGKELRSYALEFIAKKENLGKKIRFTGTVAELWRNHPEIIYVRNVTDVKITLDLDRKYDLIGCYDTLRREFGCLFHEVLTSHRVIDTGLLRMVNGQTALGTVKIKGAKGRFLGAIVIEPEAGHYYHVLQLDFSREYPNIIKSLNISPDTYNQDGEGFYKIESPDGEIITFNKEPMGLFPRFIEYLFKLRDAIELNLTKHKDDKVKFKYWHRRMWAVKTITNACYGVMAYEGFRLNNPKCSRATALAGRQAVSRMKNFSEEIDYRILYGDTDSIFVLLKTTTINAQLKEAKMLEKAFNADLAEWSKEHFKTDECPFKLSKKRIYSDWITLSKKQYGGKYIWDEKKGEVIDYEFKNIAVRSDTSDLEERAQRTVMKMFLNRLDIQYYERYRGAIKNRIDNHDYEPLYIAYPAGIQKKTLDAYKVLTAHIKAVIYSNNFLGTDFQPGDKPRRLSIKPGIGLFGKSVFVYKGRSYKLKDIAINEYVKIPKAYLESIDWQRIWERLNGKIERIKRLEEKSIGEDTEE